MKYSRSISKIHSKQIQRIKNELTEYEKPKCAYCHEPLTKKTMTADHIVPRSKGGLNFKDNIAISCEPCNTAKGSLSVSQFNKLIKGTVPDELPFKLVWIRRKIWLATERVIKKILT